MCSVQWRTWIKETRGEITRVTPFPYTAGSW